MDGQKKVRYYSVGLLLTKMFKTKTKITNFMNIEQLNKKITCRTFMLVIDKQSGRILSIKDKIV